MGAVAHAYALRLVVSGSRRGWGNYETTVGQLRGESHDTLMAVIGELVGVAVAQIEGRADRAQRCEALEAELGRVLDTAADGGAREQ